MRLRHVALARRPAAIAEVEEIDRIALPGRPLRSQEAGVPAKVIENRAAGVIRSKRLEWHAEWHRLKIICARHS